MTLVFLSFSEKIKINSILIIGVTTLIFGLLYIAYGTYYDATVFWHIIGVQSTREVGPETFFYLLSTPIIVNKIYYDGWYFLGFLSLFVMLCDYQKNKYLIISAFCYLLLLIFSLTKNGEMGWYLIPLFPFLAIATAHVLKESFETHGGFIFPLLLFVGMTYIRYLFTPAFGLTTGQFRSMMALLFGPSIVLLMMQKNTLHKKIAHLWFYFFIALTFVQTYTYQHPA